MQEVQHKLHSGPHNYAEASASAARQARSRLEQRFADGRRHLPALLNAVEDTVPTDFLVPSHAVDFAPRANGVALKLPRTDEIYDVHPHALQQLGTRASIPLKYVRLLQQEDPELLAHNLTTRYQGQEPRQFLGRVVGGQLLGWLSSSYRRFNVAPLLVAFLEECSSQGAVPVDGRNMTTKLEVKALMAKVFEPIENETLAIGLAFRSSDFGDGALSLRLYLERIICTNGMTAEECLRRVHLGARLDSLTFSRNTHELDEATMASAVRDVVRASMTPQTIGAMLDVIRDAHVKQVHIRGAIEALKRGSKLTKDEADRVLELHGEPSVELLPPIGGKRKRGHTSAYRLSNVVGLLAQEVEPRRALDLQDLAGEIAGLQRAA